MTQTIHVRDIAQLLAEGLVPLAPDAVRDALRDVPNVSVDFVDLAHHKAVWASSAGNPGHVEVCAVHVYCEHEAPNAPVLWLLRAWRTVLDGPAAMSTHILVCLSRPETWSPQTKALVEGLFAETSQGRNTKTSLLQLDLSEGQVPDLAREVLSRCLMLA